MKPLALLLVLASAPAAAADADRLAFALEAAGHLPSDLEATSADSEALPLGAMRPPLHELSAAYGIVVSELASEVVLRVGFGWASGALPAGSLIGNAAGERYALRSVPLSVGWRMTLAPYRVRPLFGADAGGRFSSLEYTRSAAEPVTSGWGFQWGLRALLGLHADLWGPLGVRLFAEGRWSRAVQVAGAPDLALSGFGAGLAVVGAFDRPAPGALAPPRLGASDGEPELRDYGDAAPSRLSEASELIRRADEAVRARSFIEAEALYRRGVGLLPRDLETRKNLEAPVLVDWARVLLEIGRGAEAHQLVDTALELDPKLESAHDLLDRIFYP